MKALNSAGGVEINRSGVYSNTESYGSRSSAKLGERWLRGRLREPGLERGAIAGGSGSALGQTEEEGEKRTIGMRGRVITGRIPDKYGDTLVGREKLLGWRE